jgi:hypothetical protein
METVSSTGRTPHEMAEGDLRCIGKTHVHKSQLNLSGIELEQIGKSREAKILGIAKVNERKVRLAPSPTAASQRIPLHK